MKAPERAILTLPLFVAAPATAILDSKVVLMVLLFARLRVEPAPKVRAVAGTVGRNEKPAPLLTERPEVAVKVAAPATTRVPALTLVRPV